MQSITVEVIVGGMKWTGFTRVTVNYSAKQAVRAFAMTVTDSDKPWEGQWNFMPGTPIQIMANGRLLLDGYIDSMIPSHDGKNHHVEISGRSKSQDSVDSSADHETGEFKNKSILEVAKELDKQGVGFSCDFEPPKVPLFRVNPGESVFSAVERMARKQQLLLIGQADGSVKIAKGGEKRVHPPLVLGQNILAASANFDASGKNSEYKVRGQKVFGSDRKSLRVEGKAKDSSVKRNRPRIILPESDIDEEGAKKRAEHHRDRQNGESISAKIKTQGWFDDNGSPWEPNTLVFIDDPFLKLSMDLLLDSVSLSQDAGGSFSQLSFVHPKALGSKASTGSKTDPAWKSGEG